MKNNKQKEQDIWYGIFKETLIALHRANGGYKTWKVIYEQVRLSLYTQLSETLLYSQMEEIRGIFNSPDTMRMTLWPRLQQDQKFKEEWGVYPISKNSVGIKLTEDIDEVREFVEAEYGRAMAILKKVSIFKRDIKDYIEDTQFHNIMELVDEDPATEQAVEVIADKLEEEGFTKQLTGKDLEPGKKYIITTETGKEFEIFVKYRTHFGIEIYYCDDFYGETIINRSNNSFDKEFKILREVDVND